MTVRPEDVDDALAQVFDPCSVASKVAMSVVDMGLVRGWRESDGVVTVDMIVTSLSCSQAPLIMDAIRGAVGQVSGVSEVVVDLDRRQIWGPELMSNSAAERLDARHERARRLMGLKHRVAARPPGSEASRVA